MPDAQVNWYGEGVLLAIEDATDDMLRRVAFLIEGQTKVNITDNGQVDTGFMRASVYVRLPDDSSYGAARSAANGRNPDATMAPETTLSQGEGAAIVVGAGYAIYQEVRNSFLYRALEQVAPQVGGVIERVARDSDLTE